MTNKEIAAAMRAGSARYWPDATYQAHGVWRSPRPDGEEGTCYAQMLTQSLGCARRDDTFNIAARAILWAAGIMPKLDPLVGIDLTAYIVGLNEGVRLARPDHTTEVIPARHFAELKRLVEVAADLLDGGEGQPADGVPAQEEAPAQSEPVEMPPPNPPQEDDAISPNPIWEAPSEQPAPLPTSLTNLLVTDWVPMDGVKEKEFA